MTFEVDQLLRGKPEFHRPDQRGLWLLIVALALLLTLIAGRAYSYSEERALSRAENEILEERLKGKKAEHLASLELAEEQIGWLTVELRSSEDTAIDCLASSVAAMARADDCDLRASEVELLIRRINCVRGYWDPILGRCSLTVLHACDDSLAYQQRERGVENPAS